MQDVIDYLDQNRDAALEQLKELLRIPTVSADSAFAVDMLKGAAFVHNALHDAGLSVETIETPGASDYLRRMVAGEGCSDRADLRALRCAAAGPVGLVDDARFRTGRS